MPVCSSEPLPPGSSRTQKLPAAQWKNVTSNDAVLLDPPSAGRLEFPSSSSWLSSLDEDFDPDVLEGEDMKSTAWKVTVSVPSKNVLGKAATLRVMLQRLEAAWQAPEKQTD